MKTTGEVVVYDAACKVCTGLKNTMVFLQILNEKNCRAFQDLPENQKVMINPDRFRNEMALIEDEKILYGPTAIAKIFSSRFIILRILLKNKFFFSLFTFLYRIVAFNRYIIATPRNSVVCDCFPDNVKKYRIAYIIITYSLAIILTALAGISFHRIFGFSAGVAALYALLIVGSGWIIQLIIALLVMDERKFEYAGHVGSIMVAGLLVLVPAMIIVLCGVENLFIPLTGTIISSFLMLNMHIKRTRFMHLSQWWTVSWFMCLQIMAIIWIYFIFLR
jgi:predicted DCC family thiol-disulfide oxidoreductase YuxK